MSERSKIEWTDATWNPVRGCTKISAGCKHCYAETFSERFRGVEGHPFEFGFDLRLVPEKLHEPLKWRRPKMIFVNSMSDLFHQSVPDDYIVKVARVMEEASWHTFQVLTKRADRLHRMLDGPLSGFAKLPNIWWGVSVENKKNGLPRILAWFLARRISGPVLEMTEASRRIAQGDLSVRVPVHTGDEVGDLARSFNSMAHDLASQQKEIERRERLAAWADMAAQVAHEVKNPLTPIQLSAEHLQRAYQVSGIRTEAFDSVVGVCTRTILESVTKLRDIASEFAAFVREPVERLQRINLTTLAAEVLRPYQDVGPEGLRIVTRFDTCFVLGESKLIERAIRNLIENSIQALGGAGEMRFSCRPVGDLAELVIEDTGPGFDEETRDRLFEPFFSTKTQGSGLGLALVKKVAEDFGGSASLERDGTVTRAMFRLPLAPG